MAGALALLGTEHALLVSSEDGLDELSISAPTTRRRGASAASFAATRSPRRRWGSRAARADAVPGGDPSENADTARRIFAGEPGVARDLAVLNAGAAIYAGGGAESLKDGVSSRAGRDRRRLGRRDARAVRGAHPGAGDAIVNALAADHRVARARSSRSRRSEVPLASLQRDAATRAAAGDRRSFAGALERPGLSVIAEHKRRSPSAGAIREDLELEDVVRRLRARRRRGAVGPDRGQSFGGSLDDLRAAHGRRRRCRSCARTSSSTPTRWSSPPRAGADAILLIVAALDPNAACASCTTQAQSLGLDALVEVHDERELELAAATRRAADRDQQPRSDARLSVDTRRTFELLAQIPAGTIVVAESGFSRAQELDELEQAGVDAVLIGEALMRSPDIEAACRALTARSRRTRALAAVQRARDTPE